MPLVLFPRFDRNCAFSEIRRKSQATRSHCRLAHRARGGWSLALIGNASGKFLGGTGISIRGVFDETRRKPLVFAADAVSYGI